MMLISQFWKNLKTILIIFKKEENKMLKHAVLCEHTHTHTHTHHYQKEVTKRSLLNEGWCQCLALDGKGDIL